MHKIGEIAVSPLQGNGVCTIFSPEQIGRPCPLLPERFGGAAAMNYVRSNRERVLCSGLFSFGAACGVLWVLRSSEVFLLRLLSRVQDCCMDFPYITAAASLCIWPVIFFLLGLSPAGHFFVLLSITGAGFFAGSVCAVARVDSACFAAILFLLPVFSISYVSLAAAILCGRRLFRGNLFFVFGGRQDLGFFLSQVLLSMIVLTLSAAVLGAYLSKI